MYVWRPGITKVGGIWTRPFTSRYFFTSSRNKSWNNYNYRQGYNYRYNRFGNNERTILNQVGYRRMLYLGGGVATLGGFFYVTYLEKVPVSGRTRFIAIKPETEQELSKATYKSILREYHGKILPPNHPYTQFVHKVVQRLIPVSGLHDLKWEVYVIMSPERNAFVLPGGKIFVFTGILPIAANEDGMATILGHEIAHNVARHSAERMSIAFMATLGAWIVQLLTGGNGQLIGDLFLQYGLLLPNSRAAETEADYIGLNLMSKACFNPREAINVWRRMEAADKVEPPQFLSTHPATKNRIQKFEEWMPEAITISTDSDCVSELGAFAEAFHDRYRQQAAETW